LAAGANIDAIQAGVDAFQPGVRGPVSKKSPFERAHSALGNLSQEELQELLAEYKKKKA
jgi:hypothetical protein